MKTKHTYCIFAAIVLAILAVACATPPTEEMNNATEAVSRAENDINAVTYAGNTIARARDALSRMHIEADAKRFDSARTFAADAIAAAERAISEGAIGAARARDEASSLLNELGPLVQETRRGIDSARSSGLALNYNQLEQDFTTARGNAEQAQDAFRGDRYQDAMSLGRTARSELIDINQRLTTVALAVSQK